MVRVKEGLVLNNEGHTMTPVRGPSPSAASANTTSVWGSTQGLTFLCAKGGTVPTHAMQRNVRINQASEFGCPLVSFLWSRLRLRDVAFALSYECTVQRENPRFRLKGFAIGDS